MQYSLNGENNTALSYHVYIFFQITFECMPLILNILIFFQITFECVVMDDINTEEYEVDEGGLFITNIFLQGASWDYDNDNLKTPM
jgi:hypothetical protein